MMVYDENLDPAGITNVARQSSGNIWKSWAHPLEAPMWPSGISLRISGLTEWVRYHASWLQVNTSDAVDLDVWYPFRPNLPEAGQHAQLVQWNLVATFTSEHTQLDPNGKYRLHAMHETYETQTLSNPHIKHYTEPRTSVI